jgi:predicted NAD/FAD-dependent oxidoreductase
MPDPQAADLLPPAMSEALLGGSGWDWRPSIAVYAAWTERCWPEIDGVFVDGSPVVQWVADDGRRRGDDAPVLVAHTTPVFAASRLDDPAAAVPHVMAELSRVLGRDLDEPEWARAHRWSLATPARARPAPAFALTADGAVGVCGDAWGERSRVEAAWLSGTRLAAELAARLGLAG